MSGWYRWARTRLSFGVGPNMPEPVSLTDFVAFLRAHLGIAPSRRIDPGTTLEKDLGVTGDEGWELLEAISREYSVTFLGADGTLSEAFQLKPGQTLFHAEAGVSLYGLVAHLFSADSEDVLPVTVGGLYDATLKAERTS